MSVKESADHNETLGKTPCEIPDDDSVSAQHWMTPGEIVTVRGVSNEKYMSMTWVTDEAPKAGKVILRGVIGDKEQKIRVKVEKVSPTTLALSEPHRQATPLQLNLQFDVPYHWKFEAWMLSTLKLPVQDEPHNIDQYLNRCIPLPGLGGNTITLRRKLVLHARPLIMFPRLEHLGLEIIFHSKWYDNACKDGKKHEATLIEADILKPFDQDYIWIFCAWCKKFHLPYDGPGSHRCSNKHQKARSNLFECCSAASLRSSMGFWDVQDRWL